MLTSFSLLANTHPHPNPQAHSLFPLLTPEVLAPFLLAMSSGDGDSDSDGGPCGDDGGGYCAQFVHVQRGGHALLLLYLALRQWAAGKDGGDGGDGAPASAAAADLEGARLLAQEVAQLRVKLQALAAEMVGRLPATGMGGAG